jgi:hypothetical protein
MAAVDIVDRQAQLRGHLGHRLRLTHPQMKHAKLSGTVTLSTVPH